MPQKRSPEISYFLLILFIDIIPRLSNAKKTCSSWKGVQNVSSALKDHLSLDYREVYLLACPFSVAK